MTGLEIAQFIFYVLASLFLLGGIAMVVTIIFVFMEIKKKVEETADYVKAEVYDVKNNFFRYAGNFFWDHKEKVGGVAATAVTGFIMNAIKGKFSRKK